MHSHLTQHSKLNTFLLLHNYTCYTVAKKHHPLGVELCPYLHIYTPQDPGMQIHLLLFSKDKSSEITTSTMYLYIHRTVADSAKSMSLVYLTLIKFSHSSPGQLTTKV